MDRIEQIQNNKEGKYITEKLNSTPFHYEGIKDSVIIKFGNTGFDINFDPRDGVCTFDFFPEDVDTPNTENAAKYATLLSTSILGLHNLLNDSKKLSDLGIDLSKTKVIGAFSNRNFIESVEELFDRSDNKKLLKIAETDLVDIDVKEFKNLEENDPLMIYLKKVSERGKDTLVTRKLTQ